MIKLIFPHHVPRFRLRSLAADIPIGHILKRIFVSNLPSDATENSVIALFSEFGKVHSIELIIDMFSGKCRGFGYIGMEGHEARAAIAKLSGAKFGNNMLKVGFENNNGKHGKRR